MDGMDGKRDQGKYTELDRNNQTSYKKRRFVIKEHVVATHSDEILDFESGELVFRTEGSTWARNGRRRIISLEGNLIYSLNYRNSLWSGKSGTVTDASGSVAMTLRNVSRYSYNQTVTLLDDTRLTYVEGSGSLSKQRSAEVRDESGRLLARKTEAPSRLRGDGCFIWDVEPGCDAALMTMIALAVDESKSGSIRRDPNLLLYYN